MHVPRTKLYRFYLVFFIFNCRSSVFCTVSIVVFTTSSSTRKIQHHNMYIYISLCPFADVVIAVIVMQPSWSIKIVTPYSVPTRRSAASGKPNHRIWIREWLLWRRILIGVCFCNCFFHIWKQNIFTSPCIQYVYRIYVSPPRSYPSKSYLILSIKCFRIKAPNICIFNPLTVLYTHTTLFQRLCNAHGVETTSYE